MFRNTPGGDPAKPHRLPKSKPGEIRNSTSPSKVRIGFLFRFRRFPKLPAARPPLVSAADALTALQNCISAEVDGMETSARLEGGEAERECRDGAARSAI